MTLPVPPLRERTEDIPLLADHFLTRYSSQHKPNVKSIHADAMRALLRYRWPGNVRELEHVIERAVIVTTGDRVVVDDLPPVVRNADRAPAQAAFSIPPHHTLAEIEKLAILQTLERTRWNKRKAATILGVYRPTLYSKLKKHNLTEKGDSLERSATTRKPAQD